MKNQKICLKINDYFLETYGHLENNILSFKDNNTNILFDINNNRITKIDDELILTIDFNNKENTYFLRKENLKFNQDIKINMLQKNDNEYIINYQIEENSFNLYLSFKEE